MRKRSTRRKTSATELLSSQAPETAATPGSPNKSGGESPKELDFNFIKLISSSSAKKKNDYSGGGGVPASMFMQCASGSSPLKGINTISDLKDFASSRLETIKSQVERSHSEILKDIDASRSRLHKRFKMQTQGCQQVMDETEREYKKMYDRIEESREAMKDSFTEFMVEAQSSAARLCKTFIPEISQSFEKSINSLRSRYGISSGSPC